MAELPDWRITYYVWVTAISDSYTESIVGKLVRRNWEVSPLGGTLFLKNDDNLTTVLSFSMSKISKSEKLENELTMTTAVAEVKDVLERLGVRYYSVVLTQVAGANWSLGNMRKSELEKVELETKRGMN